MFLERQGSLFGPVAVRSRCGLCGWGSNVLPSSALARAVGTLHAAHHGEGVPGA